MKKNLYNLIRILLIAWLIIPVKDTAVAKIDDQPIPILAYYYIWFDESSWDRAKNDYPLLGNYSSDDRQVMEQHVLWAQQAGIDGFIVSWKHTDVLDPRLMQLVEVANEHDFKLAIIYQGLDFERDPLPVARITTDLQWFTNTYAQHPVFNIFGQPMVIWSGTWKFSVEDIQSVTQEVGNDLLVLGSERNLAGYLRIAGLVAGNAYYWSSVNPNTFPGYQEKLNEISNAIHERGGLWVAPAAPGFDARLIGGTQIVERADGDTLLQQLQVAFNSSPDAIGLISWNEFSENSHIEPSQNYDMRYLEVLANYSQINVPIFELFNSEPPQPQETPSVLTENTKQEWILPLILAVFLLLLVGLIAVFRPKVEM